MVGLFYTDSAGDAAYFACRTGALTRLVASAGDGHHVLKTEGYHFYQIAGAGFRTCCAACTVFVVNGCQALDIVQRIELAGVYTITEAEASEFAGLYVRQGVCRGACG